MTTKHNKFINRLSQINKEFDYNFSNTPYGTRLDEVKVVCNIHGPFVKTVQQLERASGCNKCIDLRKKEKNKLNFIEKANQIFNNKYDYSKAEYKNNRTFITILCPDHGEFQQIPSNHLKGHSCKKCQYITLAQKNTKTTKDFVDKAIEVHGNIYDYSLVDYINSNKKVKIILPSGEIAEQLPSHHLAGYRPSLDDRGLNYERPAILYYLKITTVDDVLYKIGITTKSINERFKLADLSKIEVISTENFKTAKQAFDKEQSILKKYKKYKYNGPDILVSAGNTELFTLDILNNKELKNEIITVGELKTS